MTFKRNPEKIKNIFPGLPIVNFFSRCIVCLNNRKGPIMLTITDLRVEYKKNPLGMDEKRPRFFYRLEGDSAGWRNCI